jgi:signal transduction histidine kinase/CheY-like chemotaxis protein
MADNRRLVKIMLASLILCIGLFVVIFYMLSVKYQDDNAYSSASHLIEINDQGSNSLRASLNEERLLAKNVAREMESGAYNSRTLMPALKYDKNIWKLKDFYIYLENGACVNSQGKTRRDSNAAVHAAGTMENGASFRIVGSTLEYSVPVDTELKVGGSRVVVISVIMDLNKLMERIDFAPFAGSGTIYLTRQDGVRICGSGEDARQVYNARSLFNSGNMQDLKGNGSTIKKTMDKGERGVFLHETENGSESYIVVTPIRFSGQVLYLITVMPRGTVNKDVNDFSRYLILLFVLIIILITAISAFFMRLFVRRTRRYRADIASRERLFDLLVSKTDYIFVLLAEGEEKPVYVTSNADTSFFRSPLKIEKKDGVFRLCGDKDDRILKMINAELENWDGTDIFTSGYFPYGPVGSGKYFRISLYNAGEYSDGQRREYIGIIQNATKEYQREQGLKDAIALADSANRAKSRFLSSVSHDIRTPLNAIINTARFMEKDLGDEEKVRKGIDVIQQSSVHLLGLINDVLDLSRIESGKISFVNESFDMCQELDKTCGIISRLCESKDQQFTEDRSSIQHRALIGDPVRLNQILLNLLNNAMKFTPEGGRIEFEVTELQSISRESVPFKFVVRDNGIGISPDMIDKIFDPFSRSTSYTVSRTEGNGLGLAITKSFVEALGGTVSVESKPGEGTVFTVELSYACDEKGSAEPEKRQLAMSSDSFAGRRALLAEDNEINREIASTILTGWGMTVDCAEDGEQALARYLAGGSGYYDIIYLDIQMPVLDGYQVAERIRSSDVAGSDKIPLIAMTANAFAEDVEHARASGMNRHISKPVDMDKLFDITAGFLGEVNK